MTEPNEIEKEIEIFSLLVDYTLNIGLENILSAFEEKLTGSIDRSNCPISSSLADSFRSNNRTTNSIEPSASWAKHHDAVIASVLTRCNPKIDIFSTLLRRVSWPSSGPEFCAIWLSKMPASGWGAIWELSSFVPWLVLNAFRDVSGAVPAWPWFSEFMRKSSRR